MIQSLLEPFQFQTKLSSTARSTRLINKLRQIMRETRNCNLTSELNEILMKIIAFQKLKFSIENHTKLNFYRWKMQSDLSARWLLNSVPQSVSALFFSICFCFYVSFKAQTQSFFSFNKSSRACSLNDVFLTQ